MDLNQLIAVLGRGQEQARQLEARLDEPFNKSLAQQIESAFQTAISIAAGTSNASGVHSSPSPNDSALSDSSDMADQMCKKIRKSVLRWSKQVREGGAEEPLADGYNWRKYGQKDILGAKYPRGYYRCTHRNSRGCLATKQVQRSDDDPSVLDVTYRGAHTCTSPRDQDLLQQDQQLLISMQAEHAARRTEDLNSDCRILDSSCFSFPSTPASCVPAPGTSYFSLSQCGVSNYVGARNLEAQEKELADIISAATSTASSLMVDMDFGPRQGEFGNEFSFDGSTLF